MDGHDRCQLHDAANLRLEPLGGNQCSLRRPNGQCFHETGKKELLHEPAKLFYGVLLWTFTPTPAHLPEAFPFPDSARGSRGYPLAMPGKLGRCILSLTTDRPVIREIPSAGSPVQEPEPGELFRDVAVPL